MSWTLGQVEKQRLQSSVMLCMRPGVKSMDGLHHLHALADMPTAGMDACAAGCKSAHWAWTECNERCDVGCQLELLIFAKVPHSRTGLKPTGVNTCGDRHRSVSTTGKPVAQPAQCCKHGELYTAKRTSLLTDARGLRRPYESPAEGAGHIIAMLQVLLLNAWGSSDVRRLC